MKSDYTLSGFVTQWLSEVYDGNVRLQNKTVVMRKNKDDKK